MIYLIQQTYFDEENNRPIKLLKIGYSDDLGNRMKSYYSQAPLTKLISSRSGGTLLESTFHKKFDKYKFPDEENKGYREWFYYNKEIIDSFQTDSDEDLLKPREDLIQLKFEDYFIKSISLRSPEKLYKEDKDNLINLLQNEIKLNPDLSEFYEEDKASELFKSNLEKYHLELTKTKDSYVRSIDFIKTLRSRDLSIEFSDANIDTLAVDITLDLPQILGRQRLSENPWCNSAVIYYKPLKEKPKLTFRKLLLEKKEETTSLLRTYEIAYQSDKANVAKNYKRLAEIDNYKDNYVAVNIHSGSILCPKFNNLVMLSEIRAYEIQKLDYVDRVTVRNTINRRFGIAEDQGVVEVLSLYERSTTFEQKIKLICDVINTGAFNEGMIDYILSLVDDYIANYVYLLGPDKIKALSYRRTRLDSEVNKRVNNQSVDNCDIQSAIFSSFSVQEKLSKSDLKLKLKDLYGKLGLQKAAKATDLEEWFIIKSCKVRTLDNNKRTSGFELVSIKPEYQELYNNIHGA